MALTAFQIVFSNRIGCLLPLNLSKPVTAGTDARHCPNLWLNVDSTALCRHFRVRVQSLQLMAAFFAQKIGGDATLHQ